MHVVLSYKHDMDASHINHGTITQDRFMTLCIDEGGASLTRREPFQYAHEVDEVTVLFDLETRRVEVVRCGEHGTPLGALHFDVNYRFRINPTMLAMDDTHADVDAAPMIEALRAAGWRVEFN